MCFMHEWRKHEYKKSAIYRIYLKTFYLLLITFSYKPSYKPVKQRLSDTIIWLSPKASTSMSDYIFPSPLLFMCFLVTEWHSYTIGTFFPNTIHLFNIFKASVYLCHYFISNIGYFFPLSVCSVLPEIYIWISTFK